MADEEVKTTREAETPQAPETAAEEPAKKPAAKGRKRVKRSVPHGQMHVLATFNNTIVTFSDSKGNVLTYSSAGACGFRGSKKGTAYAAQVAAERAATAVKQQYGLSKVDVFIKGIGLGRDAAVRTLSGMDIQVESIQDVTGVPHGGVRPRKARRV
ncbi:MAG TPA: 30S ribosomal protein S11 [Candidatus Saccharimonadales bacterium]|nr:30S ribosomal protein S11 [Candidatus Saccharimonadales bacterium]